MFMCADLVGWFWCLHVSLFKCQFPLNQSHGHATGSWRRDGAVALEVAQVSHTALTEQEVTAVLCFIASTFSLSDIQQIAHLPHAHLPHTCIWQVHTFIIACAYAQLNLQYGQGATQEERRASGGLSSRTDLMQTAQTLLCWRTKKLMTRRKEDVVDLSFWGIMWWYCRKYY